MAKNKSRVAHTVRLMKWIRKYPGWWQLICEAGNEQMNIHMMQMLIKRLAQDGFYELIFVLVEVHKDTEFLKDAKEILLKELLISKWEIGGKDEVIAMLVDSLE